jgi:S-formylglutathione hydrolase FrmB
MLLVGAVGPTEFEVTYGPKVCSGPVSARVYVMMSSARPLLGRSPKDPRFGPDWFRLGPIFAVEAKDWKPGEPLSLGPGALAFPSPIRELKPGEYRAQAVLRLNPDTHKLGDGEGNAYGPVVSITIDSESGPVGPIKLEIDTVVEPRAFPRSDRLKLVEVASPILSAFHHRPVKHRAAVILPQRELETPRGTLYIIPGFGGDHLMASDVIRERRFAFGTDLIRVVLDPDCGTGHHVFADSAFNGPRGKALVEELIPYIERTFPAIAKPQARFVNGHSSGGWSSLWLQINYPEMFGGVWSTSPDSVDFRDFQRVNLYEPGVNLFRDGEGNPRPIARMGRRPFLFYESFSNMEDVIGDGGQLHSFEAVFSPLEADGRPRPLYDRATGAVDPETAKAWEAHDIRLVLERGWKSLAPKLAGKIHIVMGGVDTFYLDGALERLKESLKRIGGDAVIEIVPNRDHFTLMDAALAERFNREMNAALEATRRGQD